MRNFFILFFAIGKLAAQEAISADDYVGGLMNALLGGGPPVADLFMRQHAEAGVDLRPLKRAVLENNAGQPQKIEVVIHPNNRELIEFMQERLIKSGVDFVTLVPVIDDTLPDPEQPHPDELEKSETWKRNRKIFIGGVSGLALVAASYFANREHGIPNDFRTLANAAVAALFVLRVEAWTASHSSALNVHLFSRARFQEPRENSLTHKKFLERVQIALGALAKLFYTSPMKSIPELASIAGQDFADTVRDLSRASNKLLIDCVKVPFLNDGKPFLTAGFYYINLFNMIYHMAIYTVSASVSYFTGVAMDKTWVEMLWPTVKGTFGFYLALAMNQNLLGRLNRYGYTGELPRMQAEIVNIVAAKPGRMIMTHPSYTEEGKWLMIFGGLLNTIPAVKVMLGLNKYARTTAEIYARNAELAERGELETQPFTFTPPAPVQFTGNGIMKEVHRCLWMLKGGHLTRGVPLNGMALQH